MAAAAKPQGHVSHTKDSAIVGLPGTMPRPIKVIFVD